MRIDSVLLCAAAAVAGGVGAVYPLPTLLCASLLGVVLGRDLSPRARCFALLCFVLAGARGARQIQAFEAARIEARDAIGPP